MSIASEVLPLAAEHEPVRYVVVDDEPAYRKQSLPGVRGCPIERVADFGTVDALLATGPACHVIVLDLCLNRQTGDAAVLQGVRAIRTLHQQFGHRVLVHSADERPDPVARCIAAGAVGYVSKYDPGDLARAIYEVGRCGYIVTAAIEEALRKLARRSQDIRLSEPLEQTLLLLGKGLSDAEVARRRYLSPRTIEGHKRKILELFGEHMESRVIGFADLARELGVGPGDLVNDQPSGRPVRGRILKNMPWAQRRRPNGGRQPEK